MFIELIDMLRCTRPHEDSWLVATFHEMLERDVVQGLLSCPVCTARYPITGGVAYFDELPGAGDNEADGTMDDGTRIAAYLNLVEPGVVVLGGTWAGAVEAVEAGWVPVLVRGGPGVPHGNRALIERGGLALPDDAVSELVSVAALVAAARPSHEQQSLSLAD